MSQCLFLSWQVSEDDKDAEDPSGGAAKSKKKRKKKKKTEEEAAPDTQAWKQKHKVDRWTCCRNV